MEANTFSPTAEATFVVDGPVVATAEALVEVVVDELSDELEPQAARPTEAATKNTAIGV